MVIPLCWFHACIVTSKLQQNSCWLSRLTKNSSAASEEKAHGKLYLLSLQQNPRLDPHGPSWVTAWPWANICGQGGEILMGRLVSGCTLDPETLTAHPTTRCPEGNPDAIKGRRKMLANFAWPRPTLPFLPKPGVGRSGLPRPTTLRHTRPSCQRHPSFPIFQINESLVQCLEHSTMSGQHPEGHAIIKNIDRNWSVFIYTRTS